MNNHPGTSRARAQRDLRKAAKNGDYSGGSSAVMAAYGNKRKRRIEAALRGEHQSAGMTGDRRPF